MTKHQEVQIVVKKSIDVSKESSLGLELALRSSGRLEQVSNGIDIEVFSKTAAIVLTHW